MKIVYLITGSGGSFYCGNCYRDMIYLRAIRKVPGISARGIPLYLPPDKKASKNSFDVKSFWRYLNVPQRESAHVRNMPLLLKISIQDLFKLASHMAGTTGPKGWRTLH
jgi:hypothetical protein